MSAAMGVADERLRSLARDVRATVAGARKWVGSAAEQAKLDKIDAAAQAILAELGPS